jgi:hypothetical protein
LADQVEMQVVPVHDQFTVEEASQQAQLQYQIQQQLRQQQLPPNGYDVPVYLPVNAGIR